MNKSEFIRAYADKLGVTIKEAEVGVDGEKELRCTVCNHVLKSETIPALANPNPPTDDPSNSDDEPINPEPPVEEPKFIKGDVNESGDIDSMDYVLLKRAYFGTYQLTNIAIGDIDDDNVIGAMDYVYLRRAYFGTYVIK